MKFSNQTNRILGNEWLRYHPYNKVTETDNYYITLCNKVLKIIRQSEISAYLNNLNDEKGLACMLVAYFEDVISETRLFSTFTRLHKKMYGKALPFYITDAVYYDDEINLPDVFFVIWYHISIQEELLYYDPYFNFNAGFNIAVTEIYKLFDSEFEKAPQNEQLQQFLQLAPNSDLKTVREKLTFIAQDSFLWHDFFGAYFDKVLDEYKKNDVVVLDEGKEKMIYDKQIHFLYNECMPLLSLRANEYFAEILGEDHPEYHFLKNISKRIIGCFLLCKIEKEGYLIEHLTSKKQLFLSNESFSFDNIKLVENDTVIINGLVKWKDDVWYSQGACLIKKRREIDEDPSAHLFDDEQKKTQFLNDFGKAFLQVSNGERAVYLRGYQAFADFYKKLLLKHAKISKHKLTKEQAAETTENLIRDFEENKSLDKDEAICIFFNPNSGIEIFRERIVTCINDKNNPYYASEQFFIIDLLLDKTFSIEFIEYLFENKIINLKLNEGANPQILPIMIENFDFLLRFFRGSHYFTNPEVTLAN